MASRIDHTNCNHPETRHANAQCRADREFATRTVGNFPTPATIAPKTTRIDHTNCSHPRTPAGRAACRKDWHRPEGIPGVSVPLTREQLMEGMTTTEKARFARQLANDAARAAGRLAKRTDSKGKAAASKVTDVAKLPIPKLTPEQLASPVFQSLMRKREV